MNECPFCYAQVSATDAVCPRCGRRIEQWKTGFHSREPLSSRTRTMVWIVAGVALVLIIGGFARSCHWL
ncbi:MAG TPA: hypothetical protein VEG84_08385 [Thermoanaerobaculia bacterium]|nr:hypothetical protein [Thermoanaerobaculia bacterium]